MSNVFGALDFEMPGGHKIKAAIEGRLAELRAKLEDPSLPDRDTQVTRGAIRELRAMLQPAAPMVTTPRYSGMDFKRGNA